MHILDRVTVYAMTFLINFCARDPPGALVQKSVLRFSPQAEGLDGRRELFRHVYLRYVLKREVLCAQRGACVRAKRGDLRAQSRGGVCAARAEPIRLTRSKV